MPKRRQQLELKVVLDTNAIFTDSERYLLKKEISELVTNNHGDAHLRVQWLLPAVVIGERTHQMRREAAKLLPALTRLELIIGHPLHVTEATTNARITAIVEE